MTTPQGAPVSSARVQLLDEDGRVVETRSYTGRPLEFCDFGFGPHSISIDQQVFDAGTCFPVTVSNVRVLRDTPIVLRVVVNPCQGYREWSSCWTYLRIRSQGYALPGAQISLGKASMRADAFGRAWIPVSSDRPMQLTISHDGYKPQIVDLSCDDRKPAREVNLVPR